MGNYTQIYLVSFERYVQNIVKYFKKSFFYRLWQSDASNTYPTRCCAPVGRVICLRSKSRQTWTKIRANI